MITPGYQIRGGLVRSRNQTIEILKSGGPLIPLIEASDPINQPAAAEPLEISDASGLQKQPNAFGLGCPGVRHVDRATAFATWLWFPETSLRLAERKPAHRGFHFRRLFAQVVNHFL